MQNRKFTNTGLLFVALVMIFGLFGLSTVFAASRAGHINLLLPQIDVQATARAIQIDNRRTALENDFQQRMTALQTQIDQADRSLKSLNRAIATQTSQQNSRLGTIQEQAAARQHVVDNLRATATFLERTVSQEETTYQLQLVTIKTDFEQSEADLQTSLQAVSTQLAQAEAQLSAQQTRASVAGDVDDAEEFPAEFDSNDDHNDDSDHSNNDRDDDSDDDDSNDSEDSSDDDDDDDDKQDDDND